MRFGLIGYGAWGRFHADAIGKTPGAELAAIACASEATAVAARERHPTAKVHLDWRALLADRSIDAVDIVVPNHLHAEVAIAALEAGKNVLLEKPMAGSIADCDRIVEAVRRTGKVLSVGHEFRVSSQWGLVRRLIRDGEIGEPLYANVSLFRFPYRPGAGGWRYEGSRVGSWILEEPVHFFDMLMWWFEELGDPHLVHGFGNAKERDTGARHVRQFLGRHALAQRCLCRGDANPGGLRASPRRRGDGQRRVDPGLVVGRHGPHGRSPARAESPAPRPQPE